MTGYILFMLFFVSSPAAPGKQVWSLHNTDHVEFATMDACKKYGTLLQKRLASTATTTMRGWCVNKDTGDSTFSVDNPFDPVEKGKDIYEIPSH